MIRPILLTAILAASLAPLAAHADDAPRAGKYVCLGYSGGAGKFRFYVTLANGTYTPQTPDLPSGNYRYDAATHRLEFTSGPFKANNWLGIFSIEREGKTHKVVLRDRANEAEGPRVKEYANLYCTNSTDSTYPGH